MRRRKKSVNVSAFWPGRVDGKNKIIIIIIEKDKKNMPAIRNAAYFALVEPLSVWPP